MHIENEISTPVAEGTMPYTVLAFYRFLELSEQQVNDLRSALLNFAASHKIGGLVILSREGINATVAAVDSVADEFASFLISTIGAVEFKKSAAPKMPFRRFKIDTRPELITLRRGEFPITSAGTLSPSEWNEMMADDDCIIIDTRNRYETAIGMFKGAVDPQIDKFSDFPKYIESAQLPKEKKYLLYCTGGIRCEKAVEDMRARGFDHVYQLGGGILRYLEQFPDSKFEGECFVFDHRVSVDQHLQPSQRYSLCPHCGNPGDKAINCENCMKPAVICVTCAAKAGRISCSKNCRHHINLRMGKANRTTDKR